jgi:hypothetical protein
MNKTQISDKIGIWTNFKLEQILNFEQISTLNRKPILRKMNLDNNKIWTNFEIQQFLKLNKFRIWKNQILTKFESEPKIFKNQKNKIWYCFLIWTLKTT